MRNRGIGFWLAKRRLKNPGKAAVVFGDDVLTYGELADAADHVAAVRRGHEHDVAGLCDRDPVARVARERERGVGQTEHESTMRDSVPVDHVLADGHLEPRGALADLDQLHPEPGAGGVLRPHRRRHPRRHIAHPLPQCLVTL